jgi:hypothetical protein
VIASARRTGLTGGAGSIVPVTAANTGLGANTLDGIPPKF